MPKEVPTAPPLRADLVGVVLAGGNSSRMGTNKALVRVNGTPLIQHVARTLQCAFESVVIIANEHEPYDYLHLPVYPDVFPGCGPMGGAHAAFRHTGAQRIFIAACDMPNISLPLVHHLVTASSGYEAAVAEMKGMIHPTFGVYSASLLPEIEQRLMKGECRMKDLLTFSRARAVPIGPQLPFFRENLLFNMNSPLDIPVK